MNKNSKTFLKALKSVRKITPRPTIELSSKKDKERAIDIKNGRKNWTNY